MVATSREHERATHDLKVVRLMLGDLPEIAEEWDTIDDLERASWSMDWADVVLGYWRDLTEAHERGALLPDQLEAYRQLRAELERARPTLERLNLARPPAPAQT